ncbi:MAG: hypothetical protein KatS3mg102_0098 [Planctomycetota bacterium]|nr:MAG: hypothetical protein KatS3mg102_0098 [Planctomycetota bacterium]
MQARCKKRAVLFALAALLGGAVAFYTLAWRVEEEAFRQRGWHAALEPALAAAARRGVAVLVKIGAHT